MTNNTSAPVPATESSVASPLSAFGRSSTFLFVLFFFSNIPVYGFVYRAWPLPPAAIFVGAAVLLIPYLYLRGQFRFLISPISLWCFLFFTVALSWFVLFGGDNLASLLQRFYAAAVLAFSFALVSAHPEAVRAARVAMLWGVVLAIACNMLEMLRPTTFLPPGEFYGRAAGFYINPNQSGAALVLGTILVVSLVRPKLRWVLLASTLVGVILTLSRAAIIGWVVAVCLLTATRILTPGMVVLSVAVVSGMMYAAWKVLAETLLRGLAINVELLTERVAWFFSMSVTADSSQAERERVADMAWELFERQPFLGNGLGATETWSETASTHNTYLYFLADYGIVGGMLFPLLVVGTVWLARGNARGSALTFACFAALWGLFSHNIIGEYYSLLSFAVMAGWSYWSSPLRSSDHASGIHLRAVTARV